MSEIFAPRQAFVHIKIKRFPNPDGLYEVTFNQYRPYRSRTYTTNEDRVNALLKLSHNITIEAYGGELLVCASYRQRK